MQSWIGSRRISVGFGAPSRAWYKRMILAHLSIAIAHFVGATRSGQSSFRKLFGRESGRTMIDDGLLHVAMYTYRFVLRL